MPGDAAHRPVPMIFPAISTPQGRCRHHPSVRAGVRYRRRQIAATIIDHVPDPSSDPVIRVDILLSESSHEAVGILHPSRDDTIAIELRRGWRRHAAHKTTDHAGGQIIRGRRLQLPSSRNICEIMRSALSRSIRISTSPPWSNKLFAFYGECRLADIYLATGSGGYEIIPL